MKRVGLEAKKCRLDGRGNVARNESWERTERIKGKGFREAWRGIGGPSTAEGGTVHVFALEGT